MAFVKYIGLKKNFGPLKKKWMNEPVIFDSNNISNEIDKDIANVILLSMPELFCMSDPPKPDIKLEQEPEPEPEQEPEKIQKKKVINSYKLKAKPIIKKRRKKKVGTKLTVEHTK